MDPISFFDSLEIIAEKLFDNEDPSDNLEELITTIKDELDMDWFN